tara:strand:- start:485 stop:655 length:171 start_codon:yes stop_codon:yes gene_type:complete
MCSSGAHYIDWDEIEELERISKEEKEGVDPKYICNYSGLPSILSYESNKNKSYGKK